MGVDDGMVTLAWGLYGPEPQGRHVAPEEGATEGEEGPVTAAAPAPENKETQPKARPTAKE